MESAKLKFECIGCGCVFEDYRSNGPRKYCSKDCQTKNKVMPKKKNSPRWNSIVKKCKYCGAEFYDWPSRVYKKFCSPECRRLSLKGKYPKNLKGKRGTKPRTYHLKKRSKHGGVLDKEWRESVFKRDNYTCQKCGVRGGRLQAHHIKTYKEHPELRHALDNGKTLCVDCHKQTETYGWSKHWHKQRIENERKQRKLF